MRATINLKRPITEIEADFDENSIEANGYEILKWIPCKKELPQSRTDVLVSCHDDSGDTSYNYTSYGWMTTDKEYWIIDNEINNFVVAWMPLPEPYKGEQEWKG